MCKPLYIFGLVYLGDCEILSIRWKPYTYGLCHMDHPFHHHFMWTVSYGLCIPPPFYVDCFIWTSHSTTILCGLFYMDCLFHHHSIWTVSYGPSISPPFYHHFIWTVPYGP